MYTFKSISMTFFGREILLLLVKGTRASSPSTFDPHASVVSARIVVVSSRCDRTSSRSSPRPSRLCWKSSMNLRNTFKTTESRGRRTLILSKVEGNTAEANWPLMCCQKIQTNISSRNLFSPLTISDVHKTTTNFFANDKELKTELYPVGFTV